METIRHKRDQTVSAYEVLNGMLCKLRDSHVHNAFIAHVIKMQGTRRFPHIAYKQLVSMKVHLFYKNGNSSIASLKKSVLLKGMKKGCCPISFEGLKKTIKKFEVQVLLK